MRAQTPLSILVPSRGPTPSTPLLILASEKVSFNLIDDSLIRSEIFGSRVDRLVGNVVDGLDVGFRQGLRGVVGTPCATGVPGTPKKEIYFDDFT